MDKHTISAFEKRVNYTGLVSIGVFCFLYSMYTSAFAEIHVFIPPLDFPIFVGEMLLSWCMILLFLKWRLSGFPWNRLVLGLGLYLAWILVKALGPGGYFGGYGALAFRNAALFYYLLFGVLGCAFYDQRFFSPLINFILMVVLGVTLYLEMVNDYYWLAYVLLFILLAIRMPKRWIMYLSLGAGLIFFPWKTYLFGAGRSHLIGVIAAFLFFFFYMVFTFLPFRLRYKWLSLLGLIIIFCLGMSRFADPNALKSLTTPSRVIKQFKEWDSFVKQQEEKFVLREIPVNLYNQDKTMVKAVLRDNSLVPYWGPKKQMPIGSHAQGPANMEMTKTEVAPAEAVENAEAIEHITKIMQDTSSDGLVDETRYRSLGIAYGNMHFRLFIWRDMLEELWPQHILNGVGFGKPQRSRSIEIIGWGKLEWTRTGWITPHNSYFHIVYRAGIIGILLIAGIFVVLMRMIKGFAQQRSVTGGLLITILIYWLMLGCFLVFLEFPYNAIPFWSLWGMTMAYCKDQLRTESLAGPFFSRNRKKD